jgi:hypothetical protein
MHLIPHLSASFSLTPSGSLQSAGRGEETLSGRHAARRPPSPSQAAGQACAGLAAGCGLRAACKEGKHMDGSSLISIVMAIVTQICLGTGEPRRSPPAPLTRRR